MVKKDFLNASLSHYIHTLHKESAHIYAPLLAKGVYNQCFIPHSTHQAWPFWVYSQKLLKSPHTTNNTNLIGFFNTSFRNWTYLGLAKSPQGLIIDPTGLCSLKDNPFSVDHWLGSDTSLILPHQKTTITQHYDPLLHSVTSTSVLPRATLTTCSFLGAITNDQPAAFTCVSVENTSETPLSLSLFIAIRPFDLEGITAIERIDYLSSQTLMINQDCGLILNQKPANIVCLPLHEGDVSEHIHTLNMILSAKCPAHQASAFAQYPLTLAPHATQSITYTMLPIRKKARSKSGLHSLITACKDVPFTAAKHAQQQAIKDHTFPLAITLPDPTISHFIRAQYYPLASLQHHIAEASLYTNTLQAHIYQYHIYRLIYMCGGTLELPQASLSRNIQTTVSLFLNDTLPIAHLSTWFEDLCYLHTTSAIPLSKASFISLQSCLHTLLKRCAPLKEEPDSRLYRQRRCPKTQRLQYCLADTLALIVALIRFESIASTRLFSAIKPKKTETILQSIHPLTQAVKTLVERHAKKVLFHSWVPVTLSDAITLDTPTTLLLFLKVFPDQRHWVNNTLSALEKRHVARGLLFSHAHPMGYPMVHNLSYSRLLSQIAPKQAALFRDKILQLQSDTHGFPDVIHPLTKKGSYGDGHNVILGTLLLREYLTALVQETPTGLALFHSAPSSWLLEGPVSLTGLQTQWGTLSLKLTQHSQRIELDIQVSTPLPSKQLFIHTQHLFTHVVRANNTLTIDDPILIIPFSSTSLTFLRS